MEKCTYLDCKHYPWQASHLCWYPSYKDELLDSFQSPVTIRPHGEFTEEAIYMIYVILAFVGLSLIGTSITVYELTLNNNKKRTENNRKDGHENITNGRNRMFKTKESPESYDFLGDLKSFFKCFCMVRNGSKILSTTTTEGEIKCIHGLRFIGNFIIIGFHTGLFTVGFLRNAEDAKPVVGTRTFFLMTSLGMFAVDMFLVISGFLNAKIFFHSYSRCHGNISWFNFYFKRFMRLTPVYMIVLGFYSTLFTYAGNGVLWPSYATNPVCQKDWWWHLLYINNFEESAKACLAWCWYLAADMQLYIISPIFMISLIRWPWLGYALIAACVSVSSIISFWLTNHYNLISGFSKFDSHLDNMEYLNNILWKYFDLHYIKPHARISSYLVAILLAYYLHKIQLNKNRISNSSMNLICGWIVTAIFLWTSCYSLYDTEPHLVVKSLYNSSKHLLFSCGVSWVIYVCVTGQSKFLNDCLSWRFFLPLSRLSYCSYLIHMIILARQWLQAEDFMTFGPLSMIWIHFSVCFMSYVISFFISMIFEIPVLNLLERFNKKKVKED